MTPEEYVNSRDEIARKREERRRRLLMDFASRVNLLDNLELAELLLRMQERIDELEQRG